MDVTANVDNTKKIQPDTTVTSTPKTETKSSGNGSSFEAFFKSKFNESATSISEEALFASIVEERIQTLKGAEAASKYTSEFSTAQMAVARPDGVFSREEAAKMALTALRSGGVLTSQEADKIYSESFTAAQLDGNTDLLYDDRGGPNDPTIATANFATALGASGGVMNKILSGVLSVTARSLDESAVAGSAAAGSAGVGATGAGTGSGLSLTPAGTGVGTVRTPTGEVFDGQNGFLFKPISENQGTLAVLLPEDLKGKVTGVMVQNADGDVVDSGTSTGFGDDGSREKFSFSKKGGDYGKDLTVRVQLMDGTHVDYLIPDGSKRYD